MTCRLCQHQFCWLCFQDWNNHNQGRCGKLALVKKEEKELVAEQTMNFNNKGTLSVGLKVFNEHQMQKEKDFEKMKRKYKEKYEENYKKFKTISEIEEFLFLSSKVPFVFTPSIKNRDQIKNSQEKVNKNITRYRNVLKNDKYLKEALDKSLMKHIVLLDELLNQCRNRNDIVKSFDV